MSHIKRFLTCRRGVVALESALAIIPLMLCLTGVFQIVQTLFAGDLLQRAAHRVARANALAETTASDVANLESRIGRAINTEIGNMLDFDLAMNTTCPQPSESQEAGYCLSVKIETYNSPSAMNGQLEPEASLGGNGGDMVVVRMRLQPRSVLGQIQQTLFGDAGLRAVAVVRNEERIPA